MGGSPTTTQNEKSQQNASGSTTANTSVTTGSTSSGTTTGSSTGTSTSTTSGGYSSAIDDVVKQLQGLASSSGLTAEQQSILDSLTKASGTAANDYGDTYKSLISYLSGGGDWGQGDQSVKDAYGSASKYYNDVLNGYYLNNSNPYLQNVVSNATDTAYNQVADRYAAAGRGLSGGQAAAATKAIGDTINPYLFSNYQNERNAQTSAAGGITSAANAASNALNQSAAGKQSAKTAATSVIDDYQKQLENYYNTAYANSQEGQNQQTDKLSKILADLVSASGTQSTTSGQTSSNSLEETISKILSDYASKSSGTSESKGTSSGTTTTTTETDPTTAIISALLGGLGAYYGSKK